MAHYTPSRPAPFGAVSTYRAVALVENGIAAFKAWNTARRTASDLAKLSDHQLEDIGLSRSNLNGFSASFIQR